MEANLDQIEEVYGEWWLGEDPKILSTGRLRYLGDTIWLELRKELRHNPDRMRPFDLNFEPTILGETVEGQNFTLEACLGVQNDDLGSYPWPVHYTVGAALQGEHIAENKSRVFREVWWESDPVTPWIGIHGLSYSMPHKNKLNLDYEAPRPIQFKFKGMTVSFEHIVTPQDELPRSLTLKHDVIARLASNDPVSHREWMTSYIAPLSRFISFCIGEQAETNHVVFPLVSLGERQMRVVHHFPSQGASSQLRYNSVLLPFNRCAGRLDELTQNWIRLERDHPTVVSAYMQTSLGYVDGSITTFLTLVQALEGYHRWELKTELKIDHKVRDVMDHCPPRHRKWLGGLLRHANEPSLSARLNELTKVFTEFLSSYTKDSLGQTMSRIAKLRNSLIHETRQTDIESWDVRALNVLPVAILRLNILVALGFSASQSMEIVGESKASRPMYIG